MYDINFEYINLTDPIPIMALNSNDILFGKFQIVHKFDIYDELYYAYDITNNNTPVVVKTEVIGPCNSLLRREYEMYKLLEGPAFVNVLGFGVHRDYRCLVMEEMGLNVQLLFKQCNYKFSLNTVLQLADSMISKVAKLHFSGIIHRDIKPENFVMGKDAKSDDIFLIDFNLAHVYSVNGAHIIKREKINPTGNACFLSLTAHEGIEQSRRDDMESLGYTLIYLAKGKLPWKGKQFRGTRKEMCGKIYHVKSNVSIDELCKGLPQVFADYMKYVRDLPFETRPDYHQFRNMFRDELYKNGFSYDNNYDWKILDLNSKPTQETKDNANEKIHLNHNVQNDTNNDTRVKSAKKIQVYDSTNNWFWDDITPFTVF